MTNMNKLTRSEKLIRKNLIIDKRFTNIELILIYPDDLHKQEVFKFKHKFYKNLYWIPVKETDINDTENTSKDISFYVLNHLNYEIRRRL